MITKLKAKNITIHMIYMIPYDDIIIYDLFSNDRQQLMQGMILLQLHIDVKK